MSEEIKRGPGRPRKDAVEIKPVFEDKPEINESEGDFISRHEDQSRAKDLVVTKVIYPGAAVRTYQGLYSGIPVEDGVDAVAIYSDGSRNK